MGKNEQSIHDFTVNDLSGEAVSLADYEGKVLLVVNTASKCGFTPQLQDLETLYQEYKDKEFVVLGFPSNDFGGQEPLEGAEIGAFCQKNYGVSFPVFEKTVVKGKDASDLYKFLSAKQKNAWVAMAPKWNFHKYLVNKEGKVMDYFVSTTSPTSDKIKKAIDKLL